MTGWIGITLGDITGIGPEVTLKAVSTELEIQDEARFLLIGDAQHVESLNKSLGLNLPLPPWDGQSPAPSRVAVWDPGLRGLPSELAPGCAEAALASVEWVEEGARQCLRGALDALVTAPVNKEAIARAGRAFVGQTELLSQLAGADRTAMMLLGQDDRGRWVRVVLATTHLPIRRVPDELTEPKIQLAVELATKACRDLSLSRSRVGVCGLNPHAGEGGKMGTEEQTIIGPAVEAMRARGYDVVGPLSADALFYHAYHGAYDTVVAMYHDQGLAPLKMVAFESGVNWTLGLPFVRTSPDHGTAYDIAGQGKANASSMIAAIRLAKQLMTTQSEKG